MMMRFLMLAALSQVLLGCDDDPGDPGPADAAPVGDGCAAVLALTADSPLAGVLEVDHLRAACGSGLDRADVVVQFAPPTTGNWLIDAQTAAGEPLAVSVREECSDAGSQRACGDGVLSLELTADRPVFVVVEAIDADAPVEFTVQARLSPAPQLTSARVHVNPTYDTVGVHVIGDALARPVQTVELTLRGMDGASADPIILPFDRLTTADGAFEGVAGVHLVDADAVAGAQVRVFDSDQVPSAALDVGVDPPGAPTGDTCDPRRALDVCPDAQLCTPAGCGDAEVACPDTWEVDALDGDGPWTRSGNTSGAPPHAAASCGGGTGSAIYRFEAPRAGQYLFDVHSTGHPDPLLFVRSACGLDDVAAELGCNDDAAPGDLARSSVVVELDAGQTVFAFVDGYAEEQSAGGAYRLDVSEVSPPSIDDGEGFVNLAASAVGVRLAGADLDEDLAYAWMLFLDSDGAVLQVADDEAFAVGFTQLEYAGGRYTASAAVAFLEPVAALAELAMVAVAVTDDAGLDSDLAVLDVAPVPRLEDGAECDTLAALSACPADQVCARLGPVDAPPYCAAPQVACPADWPVVDLTAAPDWRHAGDTTDAPNHGDLATCSGGGPDVVYRFTAPRADRFEFVIEDTRPGADSVLFARSHCALSQVAYELACNDDRSPEDYLSTVELDLAAGETVYLFVGAYGGADLGPFTLQAR